MRIVIVRPGSDAPLPKEAVACHDVREPRQRRDVLVRKGQALSAEQISDLLERGVGELHLVAPDPGDLGESEAAQRLARAVAGPGVGCARPHHGQVSLSSHARGMLRVDQAGLDRVNAYDGVLVLTAESDRPIDVGASLGVVKCAPLFLGEATLGAVEEVCASVGPVIEVEAFQPRRVVLVAPRDRLRGGAFERARASLAGAVAWYGSSLEAFGAEQSDLEHVASAYRQAVASGADIVFAAGAATTDPVDVVFEGLRAAGGRVEQLGIPAEPGTACWIGRLGARPVLGLASCELFGRPGALDLLLPRLFTGEALDGDLLRRIAHGGLLMGPSRVAPYHSLLGAADQQVR